MHIIFFFFTKPGQNKVYFFCRNLKYPPSHEEFTLLYIPTHTRATPYFVGMFAGHVYRKTRTLKPNFRFPYPTLCLWTLVGGCILWMMSFFYFFVHEYSVWASVLYALVFRLVYSAAISAFIVVSAVNTCYTGRWPNTNYIPSKNPLFMCRSNHTIVIILASNMYINRNLD